MKDNTIKLASRYKDVNTVYIPSDDFSGIIITNGAYTRVLYDEGKNEGDHSRKTRLSGIDFEGGPMLYVGYTFGDKKIKNIRVGYYIELE